MFGESMGNLCLIAILSLIQIHQSEGCHSKAPTNPPDSTEDDNLPPFTMRAGGRSLPILMNVIHNTKTRTLKLDFCMETSVKGNGRIRRRLMKTTKLMQLMASGEERYYKRLLLLISRTRECKFYPRVCQRFEECIVKHNRPDRELDSTISPSPDADRDRTRERTETNQPLEK